MVVHADAEMGHLSMEAFSLGTLGFFITVELSMILRFPFRATGAVSFVREG
jgi:hypothetical protein